MADDGKEDLEKKLEEYATFVSTVLKPDLERCRANQKEAQTEVEEYRDLLGKLAEFDGQKSYDTEVDLAHEVVFCKASATSLDYIYVHIGMGFHAELTFSEAKLFVRKRIDLLEKGKLKNRNDECQRVEGHIQSAQLILDQLAAELQKLG